MSDPVLGLGPNLNAYRAALQSRPQSQQMQQVARLVASTLASAFRDVPFPVEAPKTTRERRLLTLRDEVSRMVEELEDVVREGGIDEASWSEAPSDNTPLAPRRQRHGGERDDVTLSVRSRQLSEVDPELLAAMERSLHPLEDQRAAERLAWLAKAQVLHGAIMAFHAQANIDTEVAQRVLDKPREAAVAESYARRVEQLEQQHERLPVHPHQAPRSPRGGGEGGG